MSWFDEYNCFLFKGELEFHGKTKAASATAVNFESFNIYSSGLVSQTSVQIHGIACFCYFLVGM